MEGNNNNNNAVEGARVLCRNPHNPKKSRGTEFRCSGDLLAQNHAPAAAVSTAGRRHLHRCADAERDPHF